MNTGRVAFSNLILYAVFVFVGVVFWKSATDDKFSERVIRWENEIKGVETKITPATRRWRRLAAWAGLVVVAIMGFVAIAEALFGYSF